MKARLYDKNIRSKGTIEIFADRSIRLQFSQNNPELMIKFRKCVNSFLRKEKLKIVSNEASARKHKNYKDYTKKIDCLDIFFKFRNPRTRKIELKPIAQTPNSASQVSKVDEHNISLKESSLEDSQISSNDETSLNNDIKLNKGECS